jgi:hypothetical protein
MKPTKSVAMVIAVICAFHPCGKSAIASPLNWTVDQTQSFLTLSVPDQVVAFSTSTFGATPVTLHFGNQNEIGNSTHAWSFGSTSAFRGTLATNYTDGASIGFLGGQSSLSGVVSGTYIPNPAVWNGTTFTDQSTAPATFGVRVHASALGGAVSADAAYFAISDVLYDVGSGILPINSGGHFVASTSTFGIIGASIASLDLNVPVMGPLQSSFQFGIPSTLPNTAAQGAISSPDPINHPLLRQLTMPIVVPVAFPVSWIGGNANATPSSLIGTLTGELVATAVVPEPSAAVLAALALACLTIVGARSRRPRA